MARSLMVAPAAADRQYGTLRVTTNIHVSDEAEVTCTRGMVHVCNEVSAAKDPSPRNVSEDSAVIEPGIIVKEDYECLRAENCGQSG
jgi:hypothetical protein